MVKYRRLEPIEDGGQGSVWKCRSDDGALVAVKYMLLPGDPAAREMAFARFRREVASQSSLTHPGIVPIISANLDPDDPYFAMPLASGSLRTLIDDHTRGLREEEAIQMFGQILTAVAYAHGHGIIHRDLKPENVLVIEGRLALSDFGLGRDLFSDATPLTNAFARGGTPGYAAPEQLVALHSADERSDVFALGRIFYELFTGAQAFLGMEMDRVPRPFRYLIQKATENDPADRFDSAEDMNYEIGLLVGATGPVLPPSRQATALVAAIADGDAAETRNLMRLLVQHPDDVELYLKVFVSIPEDVLTVLARRAPRQFRDAVKNFDVFASANHPPVFADRIAYFLRAIARATGDHLVIELAFRRLILLWQAHGRWYLRDRLRDVEARANQDASLGPVVGRVLRDYPEVAQSVFGRVD